MPASQASIGYGSTFSFESADSPGNSPIIYVQIAEVKNITPPNAQTDEVEVSHNLSPNRRKEFIAGMIDPGECSFEMNFVPNSASDLRIRNLQTAGTAVNCQITFGWPAVVATWQFLAIVKGYEISSATQDVMTATVTMRTTGDVLVS